jgi:predicted negative regulator of RcsB-dependent stress response
MSFTPENPSTPTAIDVHVAETLRPEKGLEEFLNENFSKILKLFGLILVISTAVLWWQQSVHNAAVAAAEAATKVKTVEDCDLVVQKHPGTVAAGNALLTKATLLWNDNKKDTSLAALQQFVTDFKDHPFAIQAKTSLASRLEALGKKEEALKLFNEIKSEQPNTSAGALAQLRIVDDLIGTGKVDEAKKILETYARDYQGNTELIEASAKRMGWLNAGLPTKEVDPPPAPKVEAPVTPAATPAASIEAPPLMIKPGQTGAVTAPVIVKPTQPPATTKPEAEKPTQEKPKAEPAKPDAKPAATDTKGDKAKS